MEFEFDAVKSESNYEKHGVDFVQTQQLWQDPMRIEVPARTAGEPRSLVNRADGRQALVGREQRRVNVDFPEWMIESLDREARRLGVNRQSIIKVWIAERLERSASTA